MLCLTKEESGYSPACSDYALCWMGDIMSFYVSIERRRGGGLKPKNIYLSILCVT